MNRITGILVALATLAGGAVAGVAFSNFRNGVYYSPFAEEERLEYEDESGPSKFTQYRAAAFVPKEYGKLIAVVGHSPAVFWYEDADGQVRNVALDDERTIVVRRRGRRTSAP